MGARRIVLLGIAAYAVFLIATIPARWVVPRLALPPGLAISDVGGSLWNGRASASSGADAASETRVRWHFLPARLVSARLAFAVDASGAIEGHGEVARGIGGFEARGVRARGDAARLAAFVPLLTAWRPQGSVALDAPALAWDGREARGSARVEWRDAGLTLTDVRPVGSYRIDARAEGGPLQLTVTTLAGPLDIAGRGTFAPPGALAFSGEARAQGPQAAALEPLLNLLGPRRADGARALEWRAASQAVPPRS